MDRGKVGILGGVGQRGGRMDLHWTYSKFRLTPGVKEDNYKGGSIQTEGGEVRDLLGGQRRNRYGN